MIQDTILQLKPLSIQGKDLIKHLDKLEYKV